MPALSTKTKHYYRQRIRSLLVQNPMISGEGIRQHLEAQGLILDQRHINKLVAYQKAAIQEMERALLHVVPIKPTTDKGSQLQVEAPYIKNGIVLFPRTGCEELLGQIFNLGVESHDDLATASRGSFKAW
jgi:hypothetical protein